MTVDVHNGASTFIKCNRARRGLRRHDNDNDDDDDDDGPHSHARLIGGQRRRTSGYRSLKKVRAHRSA